MGKGRLLFYILFVLHLSRTYNRERLFQFLCLYISSRSTLSVLNVRIADIDVINQNVMRRYGCDMMQMNDCKNKQTNAVVKYKLSGCHAIPPTTRSLYLSITVDWVKFPSASYSSCPR